MGEERNELVNNAVNNLQKLFKAIDDRFTLNNRKLAERYLKANMELHVIIRLGDAVGAVLNPDAPDKKNGCELMKQIG